MEVKIHKLGIRREEFSKWERRVSLTPQNCKLLLGKMKGQLIIKIQPSSSRIYPDCRFEEVGCILDEDITDCDVIIGVKQIPTDKLYKDKTYIFFSHTIKAQEQNMNMLDDILQKKIRLIDYEKIVNDKNERLVAFGKFAGNAGAIDILSGLGSFILNRGIGSPFINISQSYHYQNIEHAKNSIRTIGSHIESYGLHELISPFIVGVTGTGRCAEGALEILTLLPHEFIEPEELNDLMEESKKFPKKNTKCIYIVKFTHEHFAELIKPDNKPFDKKHYYEKPELYKGIFQEKYIQYISLLVNCIYWDDRFPRLITESFLINKLATDPSYLRLLAISDVTADFMGSIDFLKKFTTIDFPFYVFEPETSHINDDFKTAKNGILYCSIENLPCQFPLDASNHFGSELIKFIPDIMRSDITKTLEEQGLPSEIQKAVITYNGSLTNLFTYINKLRNDTKKNKHNSLQELGEFRRNKFSKIVDIYLTGHLFDTQAINEILLLLDKKFNQKCTFVNWDVGKGVKNESSCILTIDENQTYPDIIKELVPIFEAKGLKFRIEKKSENN